MSEEMVVRRMDDGWIWLRLPTVNKVFRAELALMHAQRQPDPETRGHRHTCWRVPGFNADKLLEAVEDLYPSWRVLGTCDLCRVISDAVDFRYAEGWIARGLYPPELCDDCWTASTSPGSERFDEKRR